MENNSKKPINLIVACTKNYGIGNIGRIPWRDIEDIKFFREKTIAKTGINAVVMGRRTFESIGKQLPNRINIVITSKQIEGVICAKNFNHALYFLDHPDLNESLKEIFIIGGAQLYNATYRFCQNIFITEINGEYPCDTFIDFYHRPSIPGFSRSESGRYITFSRFHEEFQYNDLVYFALLQPPCPSRTINTHSIFGGQFKFGLHKFPLLTTKRVFWRGVVEELLWMLRGETSSKTLTDKGVHIWDSYGEDLGPIYGKQWRNFGGVDQIKNCLEMIKNDPHSRRIIISAWNPPEIPQMVLPPCHVLVQFFVEESKLSCHLYQRSADIGLGMPFNIASYALLTHIFAKYCDLDVGSFTYSFGVAHIYENHCEALNEQIKRSPYEFPTLKIPEKKEPWNYEFSDFILENYKSHPPIKLELIP